MAIQNHGMVEVGRYFWRLPSLTLCSRPCQVLNPPKNRDLTTSVLNLCQHLATLTVQNLFLMFKWYFLFQLGSCIAEEAVSKSTMFTLRVLRMIPEGFHVSGTDFKIKPPLFMLSIRAGFYITVVTWLGELI